MPMVIVPAGLNLGPWYRYATPPDRTPEYWEVRLGTELEKLTEEEFQVWGRAFLDPRRHERLEINRDTLRLDVLVATKGAINPDPIINRMLARGLLVEYDTDGPWEQAFQRVAVYPIAEGMGNTPDEPERYHIGHNGVSLVKVTPLVMGLWAYSAFKQSLWHSCTTMEQDHREDLAAGMDLEPLTAEIAAHAIGVCIPMLVASGCALLDAAG